MKRSRPRTIEFQPTSRGGAWPEAARKALDARRVARYPLSGRHPAGVNAIRSRDRGPSFLVRRVLLSRLLLVRFLILALDLDRSLTTSATSSGATPLAMASLMIHLATAGGTPASSASLTRCSTTFGAISGMSCVFSFAIITSYGCEPGPGRGGSLSSDEPGDGLYHRPLGGRLRKGEIPRGRDLAGLGGYPRWRTAPSASRPAGQRLAPTRVRPEKHPHSSKICALVKHTRLSCVRTYLTS